MEKMSAHTVSTHKLNFVIITALAAVSIRAFAAPASDGPLVSSMTEEQASAYFLEKCKREGNCYPQGTFGASSKAACKKLITDTETKNMRKVLPAKYEIAYRQTAEDSIYLLPKDITQGKAVAIVETITDVLINGRVEMQLRHQCYINPQLNSRGR